MSKVAVAAGVFVALSIAGSLMPDDSGTSSSDSDYDYEYDNTTGESFWDTPEECMEYARNDFEGVRASGLLDGASDAEVEEARESYATTYCDS